MMDMQKLSILGWRFIGATTILSSLVAWFPLLWIYLTAAITPNRTASFATIWVPLFGIVIGIAIYAQSKKLGAMISKDL